MQPLLAFAATFLLSAAGLPAQEITLDKLEKEMKQVLARCPGVMIGKSGVPFGVPKQDDVPKVRELLEQALDLAAEYEGEETGFAAHWFVLNHAVMLGAKEQTRLFAESMDALLDGWIDSDSLVPVVFGLLDEPPMHLAKSAGDYLDRIVRDTKSPAAKAACALERLAPRVASAADPAEIKELAAQVDALVKQLGSRFARFGQPIADEIDRMKVIGQMAEEIAGKDLDGVPFKLSDYKGKVVLLDFWGYW